MIFKLSIRLFLREVKSGYLTSMLVSLILAITIVSGISLFTDRLEKALNSETEEFLGGKLKFESKIAWKCEILNVLNPPECFI